MVGQPRFPVGGEQAALCKCFDVGAQRQRHHIGLQTIQHRARLCAGAGVGLVDGDALAGLRLPECHKRPVDIAI
jgi:hypothetical protein